MTILPGISINDSILDLDTSGTTDILRLAPDWSNPPSTEINYGREIIQFDDAKTSIRFLTSDLGLKVTMDFFNVSRIAQYAILNFFHSHKGRLNKFWLPVPITYFNLLGTINAGAASFYLSDYNLGSYTFGNVYQGYERLCIFMNDGSLITRKISSDIGAGEYSVLSVFDRTISSDNSILFGKLILCRFDTDEIDMSHESDSLCSCSLSFQELPKEYA